MSPTGHYRQPFTDAWNNSRCNPAELVPGGNDINFSVANLFVVHNRMHDFSYYLGFNEANYNLQTDNAGRGGAGGDAEVGNVQAGAIGGLQTGMGRDNANQIAMQDGVPGITNQYLFQPIAGAFYSPCTDGGLDMGIVGHEYTHAISNRMVGGPDEGLTSEQGGAMGESWSDQDAAEYQFSHGYSNGGNVWAVGVYATGNKTVAIRDYAINQQPAQLQRLRLRHHRPRGPRRRRDLERHPVGGPLRPWSRSTTEVPLRRQDAAARLRPGQRQGASPLRRQCPGNRRWIQLIFDSFLLQQGATSMLDARDAMLAADRMRFRGDNTKVLWDAFARRGMGGGARPSTARTPVPRPSFVPGNSGNTPSPSRSPRRPRSTSATSRPGPPPWPTPWGRPPGRRATSPPARYDLLLTNPAPASCASHEGRRAPATQVVRVATPTN